MAVNASSSLLGCTHYKRKCSFLTPCCKKEYVCRVCHDTEENHILNRQDVQEVICLKCQTKQPVSKSCCNCKVEFGYYFCSICRLYDDADRQQFHCDPCGICRVGGRENFFHCTKCDVCLSLLLKDKHKCLEKLSHNRCPICLEDLHTSRHPSSILPCGHLIHRECFREMLQTENYACPLCGESMVDMSEIWKLKDEELRNTLMPDEYRDYQVGILCRDCHKESNVYFHVFGMKCKHCGSYNTCRISGGVEN